MHHDSSPDAPRAADLPRERPLGPQLVPATQPAVEDAPFSWPTLALVHSLPIAVAERWIHGGLIAAAGRMVAGDAHRCDLPFARILIALKHEWSTLGEVRLLRAGDARSLFDRLVTASIKAYYAAPTDADGVLLTDAADEPSAMVVHILLDMLHTYAPDVRLLDGAGDGRALRCPEPSDAELEAALRRAIVDMSPDEITAFVQALRQLRAALREHQWPGAPERAARGGPH